VHSHLPLLRAVARADGTELRQLLAERRSDWPAFVRAAVAERLGGWLHHQLERTKVADLLPDEGRQTLRDAYMRQWSRSRVLAATQRRLGEALDHAAIDAIFFKGTLFAERYYGDSGARSMVDVDVLLRSARDVERVEPLLAADGFQPAYGTLLGRRTTQRFVHQFTYRRERLPIEVHWVLRRDPSIAIDGERLWRDTVSIQSGGRTIRALADADELLAQILGVVADMQLGKLGWKPVIDIHRLLSTSGHAIDWDAFFALRARESTLRASVWALEQTLRWLDASAALPALADSLARARSRIRLPALLGTDLVDARSAARQRFTAFQLYDAPLVAALAWWTISLPFRIAAFGVARDAFTKP
jgi:hypothetical protein